MARLIHSSIVTFAIAMAILPAAGGQVADERIQELEKKLQDERARNDRQSRRIEELELTLQSVLDAQAATEEAMATERLGALVEDMVQRKLPAGAATARTDSTQMFSISGATRVSFRAFGGDDISTDESIELEHVLVRFVITPDDRLTLQFTPAASHDGDVFVVEAFGRYEVADWLDVTVGRFLTPFTGFHAWAFPSDSFIEPFAGDNSPKPFFYAPWWDEGLMLSGSIPFGDDDQHRFNYAGWVVNGMNPQGLTGVHKTSFGDNNENKTFGGRVSAAWRLCDDAVLTVGVGAMAGKTDAFDRLDFWAVTVDAELRWGDFGLYLEYLHRPSEVAATVMENPAVELVQAFKLSSAKIKLSYRLLPDLEFYAYADQLWTRQPPRTGGQFSVFDLDDETFTVRTYVVGAKYDFTANIRLIAELGFFAKDSDLGDDIPFAAVSVLFYF